MSRDVIRWSTAGSLDHDWQTMIGASDQGSSWAGFFRLSTAMTTASIGKGRRLKSIMNINEDMADLLS